MKTKPDAVFFLNGELIQGGRPARVYPAGSNGVSVSLKEGNGSKSACLELIFPDGGKRTERKPLKHGHAEFDLGPLCAPAVYEYENGVVFRRWYRCNLSLESHGTVIAEYRLAAVCSRDPDADWLMPDAPERCVYNDGYIAEGKRWDPFGESSTAMEPALQIRLAPVVLLNQDDVTVRFRTRPDPPVGALRARLRLRNEEGEDVVAPVTVEADTEWQERRIDVASRPVGRYRVSLQPIAGDVEYTDGPSLTYTRREPDRDRVPVSPYAPFAFWRDRSRGIVDIESWPESLPDGWKVADRGGASALVNRGDPSLPTVPVAEGLKGHYAVFLEAVRSIYVRVGDEDIVRHVFGPEKPEFGPVFVAAADMTGQCIELLPDNLERLRRFLGEKDVNSPRMQRLVTESEPQAGTDVRAGVRRIRLVPVTAESVREFHDLTANPPYELRAVDDWWDYLQAWDRAGTEQIDTMIEGQRELGISVLNWAVGRSWVQYPTQLPDAQLFPCVPLTAELLESAHPHLLVWEEVLRCCDMLRYPLEQRGKYDLRIQGWLAMNRHYSPQSRGGVFTSPWVRSHPEFYQYKKDMRSVDFSRVEYFFPEVRRERLDILEEVAAYGPDGLVIGCCRQPPMAGYNPKMVAAYTEETGVDPTKIDIEDGKPYLDWIQWRADHLTAVLRELREHLNTLERKTGNRIPVIARVPDLGLQWNLAEGIDTATWVREGLIDELQLDPLEETGGDASGEASHDVRPYVELCHKHGVPVFGGVNGSSGARQGKINDDSPVVGLRRAIGLLKTGVAGIEIYEAEMFAGSTERRWLIPLWGRPDLAEKWLRESNLEAVFPVTARNAVQGHDNHWVTGHTMHGTHMLPRGAHTAL